MQHDCSSISYRTEDHGAASVPREDKNSQWCISRFEIPQERDLPERLDTCGSDLRRLGIGWDDMRALTSAGATWPRKRCGSPGPFAADAR